MIQLKHIIFLSLMLISAFSFAQRKKRNVNKEDTCIGKYKLAMDYYIGGDFDRALNSLELYGTCIGNKNPEYLKLKSLILIVQEKEGEAKENTAAYIKTKFENYYEQSDPEIFKDLVKELLDSFQKRSITSLSKSPEDIDVASASVLVIKEEDFVKRGYLDLIDLLNDQPGFDISKIYAVTYANVYQRGFRQDNTERTLIMIDGIEENDVWSNIAFISRQYPLSNISAVEIIYGPASTIYGPRSFAGAINIITKSPSSMIKDSDASESNRLKMGINSKLTGGSYGSKGIDLNLAGTQKNVSFLITSRVFSSNGRDLTNIPFFDYNPEDLKGLIYNEDLMKNITYKDNPATTRNELDEMVNRFGLTPGSPFFNYYQGYGTGTLKINPDSSQSILNLLKKRDLDLYTAKVNGNEIGFSAATLHSYFGGKVLFKDFEFGFRTWRAQENFHYYQDLFTAGVGNGSNWTTRNSTFYTIFNKRYENLSVSNTFSYVVHGNSNNTKLVTYNSYYNLLGPNQGSTMSIFNFLFPDSLVDGNKHGWKETHYFYRASQIRNDLKLNFIRNRFNAMLGFETRNSMLQGDYLRYISYATPEGEDKRNAAQEIGTASNQDAGSNMYSVLDLGLYSQISYQFVPDELYVTVAGRLDDNRIRATGGFGQRFNPKFAAVYKMSKIVLKGIFAQGIQNPSQFTKFSTTGTREANPDLIPERIRNFEMIVQRRSNSKLNWDLSVFMSRIKNAVALVETEDPSNTNLINENIGTYTIIGSQGNLIIRPFRSGFTFFANYTITHSKQTDSAELEVLKQVADIAKFKANFGFNIPHTYKVHHFDLNIRSNFVGLKPVGPGTTVPNNRGLDNSDKIPAYIVFNSSLLYRHRKIPALRFQFTVNNLLNTKYYSPGPRTADGNYTTNYNGFVPFVPQQSRNFLLSLILDI